jgi:hypothetical protein
MTTPDHCRGARLHFGAFARQAAMVMAPRNSAGQSDVGVRGEQFSSACCGYSVQPPRARGASTRVPKGTEEGSMGVANSSRC